MISNLSLRIDREQSFLFLPVLLLLTNLPSIFHVRMIFETVVRDMLTSLAIVDTLNFLLYSDMIRHLILSGVFFDRFLGGITEGKTKQNAYSSFGNSPVTKEISVQIAHLVTLSA